MKRSVKILVLVLMIAAGSLFVRSERAQASSPYLIKINKQQNCVTIYEKDKKGEYTKPIKAMICSTGNATPLGTFSLKEKLRWHVLDGPVYGQYCSRINGHVLFHSVWYYRNAQPNTLSYTQFNNLGKTVSHGCIRICTMDAKWIYDNCPSGTKVVIYNAKNPGPLGRPKAVKLSGYMGWDPTDVTNKSNPYNKKKPTITGMVSKTVTFSDSDNILKGIKAKNTVGNDAKKLLKVTIQYRNFGTQKYKKVASVNTRKPGLYKITYKLTDELSRTVKKTVTHKVLTQVKVKSFKLNKTEKKFVLGKQGASRTFTLKTSTFRPSKASIKTVEFSSSDQTVATVNAKGVVRAKSVGVAYIYAKATDGSGIVRKCKVTVLRQAASISLTASTTQIVVGQTVKAMATVAPATTSNKNVVFTSSNENVATVNASGLISGKGIGTAVITVKTTDGSNKQASLTITVKRQYTSMDVTKVNSEYAVASGSSVSAVKQKLPTTISISDLVGLKYNATVTWTIKEADLAVAGRYEITGKVTLPEGWIGTPAVVKTTLVVQ